MTTPSSAGLPPVGTRWDTGYVNVPELIPATMHVILTEHRDVHASTLAPRMRGPRGLRVTERGADLHARFEAAAASVRRWNDTGYGPELDRLRDRLRCALATMTAQRYASCATDPDALARYEVAYFEAVHVAAVVETMACAVDFLMATMRAVLATADPDERLRLQSRIGCQELDIDMALSECTHPANQG